MTTTHTPLWRRAALLAAVLAIAVLAASAPAHAAGFGLASFSVTSSDARAGAHADVTTTFSLVRDGSGAPIGNLRNTHLQLPAGLVGNPRAVPQCSRPAFSAHACPADTQVGTATFTLFLGFDLPLPAQVFNLVPGANDPALFGIDISGLAQQLITISVRPGDAGLDTNIDEAARLPIAPLAGASLTLWGVPADHGTGAPRRPFMTNPTSCDGPKVTGLAVDSYEAPGAYVTQTASSPTPTDCASEPFAPSVSVAADDRVADSPTGLRVDIGVPQNDDPDGQASAHLRKAVVVLPEGMSIDPSMAAGLNACTDAQFGAGSSAAPSCPSESVIGTFGVDVPLLSQPLPGQIYLGAPAPGDPYRLFLTAVGSGVRLKLVGSIQADPKTGRLSAIFDDNPQMPFTRMSLAFRGGPLAPIATPQRCGAVSVLAGLTPWSGTGDVQAAAPLLITGPDGAACPDPAPFAPSFVAGTDDAAAGQDAGFTLSFGRDDRQQELRSLRMSLPAGLLGRLTAVPPCSAADGAAGTCAPASQVGDTSVTVGAGPSPLTLRGGRVYLTQPYADGDVAGLSIVVPAQVGPYDLGTVVLKAAIRMRPDGGLDISSDPLPTILGGIPLRIRQVVVNLGLKGFMFNPTDCSPTSIDATIGSVDGTDADVRAPFQVTGCAGMTFKPATRVSTTAPRRSGGPVGLRVSIGLGPAQANLRSVDLTLPRQLSARLAGPVTAACSPDDWRADRCPDASRAGSATAVTPVLPAPLTGAAYFVQSSGAALPKLAVRLKGAVTIDLVGDVALAKDGRIRTVFSSVPDVPISRFDLTLAGGRRAALTGKWLCDGPLTAGRTLTSQAGHVVSGRVRVAVAGCGRAGAARSARSARRRA